MRRKKAFKKICDCINNSANTTAEEIESETGLDHYMVMKILAELLRNRYILVAGFMLGEAIYYKNIEAPAGKEE